MSNETLTLEFIKSLSFESNYKCQSAWIGHEQIANFLIKTIKPEIIVELGVHNGFSYFVFCQTVHDQKLNTKCFGIDHWKGDYHAGLYDQKVYEYVLEENKKYKNFSKLIKKDFNSALSDFNNQSIDFLHIDGYHTYDSVKSDFNNWLPKCKKDALIVFHDVNEFKDDFGVWKLFNELKKSYSHYVFNHAHGLGIISLSENKNNLLSFLKTLDIHTNFSTLLLNKAILLLNKAILEYKCKEQAKFIKALIDLNIKFKISRDELLNSRYFRLFKILKLFLGQKLEILNYFTKLDNQLENYTNHNSSDRIENSNDKNKKISDIELEKRIAFYLNSVKKKKFVIYTAIIENYDTLKTPEVLNEECDYICFTDNPPKKHPIWQFRPLTYFNIDPTRISRYYKTHPHFYLNKYDCCIWVDANILIKNNMQNIIASFMSSSNSVGTLKHFQRDCTYQEAEECIKLRKDSKLIIERQISRYKLEGFPRNAGMVETNLLISKPNNRQAADIFNYWWKEIDNGSRRDQLSFNYVIWKLRTKYDIIFQYTSQSPRFDKNNFSFSRHQKKKKLNFLHYFAMKFFKKKYNLSNTWLNLLNRKTTTDQNLSIYKKKKVDIILTVHNSLEYVRQCLASVEPTLLETHKLIIVDDGSDKDTRIFLQQFADKRSSFVTLIRNENPEKYTKAANKGLKFSTGDYAILLNSDTIVTSSWILKLIECAEHSDEIGIVGPFSNAASWQSVPIIKGKDGSFSTNILKKNITIKDMNDLCEKYFYNLFPRVQIVNGFCICIKKSVINKIGFFDENSYPEGYNEENDLCFRAADAGFDLAIATHTYVYHYKSKSYTSKTRLILNAESKITFEKKYGIDRINRATQSLSAHPLINKIRDEISKDLKNV